MGRAEAEALRRDNEALRKENERLRVQVQEAGGEAAEPPLEEQERLLQEKLAASRRERTKLKELQRLGEQLEEIQKANRALSDAAQRLVEENKVLRDHVSKKMGRRNARKSNMTEEALSPTQKQAMTVADSLRKGESSGAELGKQQRKDLVAALLQAVIKPKDEEEPDKPETVNPLAAFAKPQPPAGAPALASQLSQPFGRGEAPAVSSRSPATAAELDMAAPVQPANKVVLKPLERDGATGSRSLPALRPDKEPKSAYEVQRARETSSKAQEISAALSKGDRSVLKTLGANERKDMIAQMLQSGFSGVSGAKKFDLAPNIRRVQTSDEERAEMSYQKQEQVRGALHGLTKAAHHHSRPTTPTDGRGSRASSRHASRHASRQGSPRSQASPSKYNFPDSPTRSSDDPGSPEENSYSREVAIREMLAQVASTHGR